MEENKITCPKCGSEINVSDILYHQVEDQLKRDFAKQTADRDAEYQAKMVDIKMSKQKIAEQIKHQEETVERQVHEGLASERARLQKSLKEQIENEKSEELNLLRADLQKKTEQVKELYRKGAEIEQLKREKDELAAKISLEKEKELTERLKDERQKMQQQREEEKAVAERQLTEERERLQQKIEEDNALKIRELEKKLHDQTELANEMKRKAEQGSMQLQGEVQELAIEEILRSTFVYDYISDVPKGFRGADVVQTVKTKLGQEAGVILYESKRTKAFSNEWIAKMKADSMLVKANVCILVTETMPKGVDRIAQIDGVWVCSYNEFKGLAMVVRDSILKINEVYASQTNKGGKMELLYNYLTSQEFLMQIEAIVSGFSELQKGYTDERNRMTRIWKEREKQLEKIMLHTNHFIGSIQGIAGSSINGLKQIGEGEMLVLEE